MAILNNISNIFWAILIIVLSSRPGTGSSFFVAKASVLTPADSQPFVISRRNVIHK